jgi:hypothetical protein
VYLTPDFSSLGVGTLSYSVSFPDTVSQAVLALYPLDAPGTKETPGTSREIAILGNATGTITDLPAGSYQALIDLYDGTNNQAAVWAGVVHIYGDATTSLVQTFIAAYFAACPEVVGKGETTLAAKLDAALASPAGSYTVVVDGTETDLASFTPKTLSVTDNKVIAITIWGGGQTVQVNAIGTPLFTLYAGLTLTIQDLTLQGRSGNNVPVVRVESQGTLEMKAGSLITGNVSFAYGSGVYVNGGTFTMSGGAVSGNSVSAYGGGVYNCGSFTMNGGVIYGSEAEGGKANTAGTSGAAIYNGYYGSVKPADLVTDGVRETTIDMR